MRGDDHGRIVQPNRGRGIRRIGQAGATPMRGRKRRRILGQGPASRCRRSPPPRARRHVRRSRDVRGRAPRPRRVPSPRGGSARRGRARRRCAREGRPRGSGSTNAHRGSTSPRRSLRASSRTRSGPPPMISSVASSLAACDAANASSSTSKPFSGDARPTATSRQGGSRGGARWHAVGVDHDRHAHHSASGGIEREHPRASASSGSETAATNAARRVTARPSTCARTLWREPTSLP